MTGKQLVAICAVGATSCVVVGGVALCAISVCSGVERVVNTVVTKCAETVTDLVCTICDT